jgi:hypothetical protein
MDPMMDVAAAIATGALLYLPVWAHRTGYREVRGLRDATPAPELPAPTYRVEQIDAARDQWEDSVVHNYSIAQLPPATYVVDPDYEDVIDADVVDD